MGETLWAGLTLEGDLIYHQIILNSGGMHHGKAD